MPTFDRAVLPAGEHYDAVIFDNPEQRSEPIRQGVKTVGGKATEAENQEGKPASNTRNFIQIAIDSATMSP
ncbi:MAG: hypothetical protein K9M97_02630 [Akkermansiaceae bacterium]|nr:hypothetical protein [Akkermansiaceae bacterium]